MNTIIFRTIVGMLLLVAVSCCKQPTPPPDEPTTSAEPRPDTVHSIVRATINGIPWEIETPGVSTSDYVTSDGHSVHRASLLSGQVGCVHQVYSDRSYIDILFTRTSNIYAFEVRKPDNSLDVLRSWDYEELSILNNAIPTIIAPFSPDVLRDITYIKTRKREVYMPGNGGTMRVVDLDSATITSVRYSLDFNDIYHDSVVYVFFKLREYNLNKHRASGDFSFKIVDHETKQIVEVKNGTFDNVPLQRSTN